MTHPNPITEQVAERLYRFARARDARTAPINAYSEEGRRRAAAAAQADDDFHTLLGQQKADWYFAAEMLIQPMLDAAAEAYSRSGTIVDADELELETQERAGRTAATFRAWRSAWRASHDGQVDFPLAAVSGGLAAAAALRAAFGYSATMTAPEITASMREHETQERAGDELRLHIASAHAYPIGLGSGDGEAGDLHRELHHLDEATYAHHVDNREWSDDEIQDAIAASALEGMPRDQFDRPYQEHTDRAPHTVDRDELRLHLMSHHGVMNAFDLRDYQVDAMHTHDHNGPGYGIRNHPAQSAGWDEERIMAQIADMDDDPKTQEWIWAGYENTGGRLESGVEWVTSGQPEVQPAEADG